MIKKQTIWPTFLKNRYGKDGLIRDNFFKASLEVEQEDIFGFR